MVDMIPPDFLIAFSTLFCELLRLRFSINDDIFRSITLGGLRALFAFFTLVAVLVLVCRLITDTYCHFVPLFGNTNNGITFIFQVRSIREMT